MIYALYYAGTVAVLTIVYSFRVYKTILDNELLTEILAIRFDVFAAAEYLRAKEARLAARQRH